MQEKSLKLNQINNWPLAILAIIFLVALSLNFVSWMVILGVLLIFVGYILLDKQLWTLLIFSLIVVILGQFINFEIRPGWVYEISLTEVTLILAVAIFLVSAIFKKQFLKIKFDNISFLLFVYLAVSLISFFWISSTRLFINEFKVVVFSLLAYWLSLNLLDNYYKIKKFIYGLAVLVFVLSLQIFWEMFQLGASSKLFMDRSAILIPIGAIALVSAVLSLMLPLLLAFYFSLAKENNCRIFVLISFLTGLIAILLIMAKAAIISLFISLLYLFIKLKHKRLALSLVFSTFIIVSSLVFAPYISGLFERVANVVGDQNTQFRKQEYQIGWKIIRQHAWFGVGVGQQPLHYQKEFGFEYRNLVNNFFMQSTIDLGLVGLIILGLIIKKIIYISKSFNQKYPANRLIHFGFIASLLAAISNGLFEVTFFALYYAIIFWVMMGAFVNLQKNQETL
ncbi:MAG: hypothetical protein UT48_C0019G0008 [Parcubacteria group bacterium GW2011_GWE2_39_37]|uniref:O-antigen ligase-related domain-containing protein n=1 Tax=Candidatus Falkowbacteria bacterium GW2011_GWF2_39_8 TaxID=1618642 RepID=A0A0G0T6I3_9BACT|nr:MAG: hypothetical protein UT48_C0019G0008 [Parcubacteria group bacterium GW2011_GWE2_39_37]KKR33457.1 MAG: hypothetical protein UT64_C0008G0012 [Candidatus Falkowbacteria bacterium GW2011_GWF2_39_8]